MDKEVEISVLLPVFKPDARYLRESVESILNQTYGNYEILLLCEGEMDQASKTYLLKLVDKRIQMIEIPENTGLSKSLNIGIKMARGRYLARMDADDVSVPTRFEIQRQYMEKHRNVDILGGVMKVMGKDEWIGNILLKPEFRGIKMMFANAGISHPTAFMKKEFFDKSGVCYDESMGGSEDYGLWSAAVSHGAVIDSVKEVVLEYRIHENQASHILSDKMLKWDDEIRRKQWGLYHDFRTRELDVLSDFVSDEKLSYEAESYKKVFLALIIGNQEKNRYDEGLFEKEMAWQWIREAVHQWRYFGSMDLLKNDFTRWCLRKGHFFYIIKCFIIQKLGR